MSNTPKSPNCHLCNGPLEKQCILSFDCSHQLCANCISVTEGRSICPTCSPPPLSVDCSTGLSTNYTRIVSNNTEQASPKLSPTSKTIDVDMYSQPKMSPSRLAVPSSLISGSSSSSPSGSPRSLSPSCRASSESCIVVRIDYTESADSSALCQPTQQQAEVLRRQARNRQSMEEKTGRHPQPPYEDDGKRRIGSLERELANYVRTLKEHSDSFLGQLNQTGINEAVFVEKTAAVEQEVKRQAKERHRAIERAEKELLLKLESRKKELMMESEAVRQGTELCIGKLDSLRKTLEEAMAKRDEDYMDRVLFEVQGDVRKVLEHRVATVYFGTLSFIYSPENFLKEDEANILGEVEFLPNKHKDDHLMFVSSPLPLIHSLDDLAYSGQAVIGLTVLANRIYVIRPSSHDIEVYHAQYFSPLPPLTLLHLMTPMLVPSASELSSCAKSQTLYVADAANSYMYRIDTEGRLLYHWKLPQNFTGLSVTDIGTVLAGSGSRIIEYDQSGKTLRTIGRSALCNKVGSRRRSGVVVDTPRHFVRQASGGIVACDWKVQGSNHVVYEIDDRGQMVSYFGGEPGYGDAELNEPCCLATAPLDHVVVADRVNGRIKLLDSGLNFVRNLVDRHQLGGGGQPNRLSLDVGTGRLYVGMTDGRIHVYRTIF